MNTHTHTGDERERNKREKQKKIRQSPRNACRNKRKTTTESEKKK